MSGNGWIPWRVCLRYVLVQVVSFAVGVRCQLDTHTTSRSSIRANQMISPTDRCPRARHNTTSPRVNNFWCTRAEFALLMILARGYSACSSRINVAFGTTSSTKPRVSHGGARSARCCNVTSSMRPRSNDDELNLSLDHRLAILWRRSVTSRPSTQPKFLNM